MTDRPSDVDLPTHEVGAVRDAGPRRTAGQRRVGAARRASEPPGLSPLLRKVQVVVGLVDGALAREALTRVEMTLGLCEALTARSEAAAKARASAFALYRLVAERRLRPRRRGLAARLTDRLLARLGWPCHALLIARSGLWRSAGEGRGPRLRDLRSVAGYARRGANPQNLSRSLVDDAWYFARYPDAAASGMSALAHYLAIGAGQDRPPNPLFDPVWYRQQNAADLAATRLFPLEHFVRVGAARGCDPHPLFSIAWYVGQASAPSEGENPLTHYLQTGWRRDASPHPLFDPVFYRRQRSGIDPLAAPLSHYVTVGWMEGLKPHPLFDPLWYLARYPDVGEAGFEPLGHFVRAGAADRRDPGPWFDTAHYLTVRGDAPTFDPNPLADYLLGGAWRVGEARPGFPSAAYLAGRPDLARRAITPLEHWASLSND